MNFKSLWLLFVALVFLQEPVVTQNITENWVNENCPASTAYEINCDGVESGIYATRGLVTGDGSVLPGFTATAQSPTSITLENGFEAKEGSVFTAQVGTCSPASVDSKITHRELAVVQENDFGYPNVEPAYDYDFVLPVSNSNLDITPNYTASIDNRYFMSLFGPRFAYRETSNVKHFDFHRGEDIINGSTAYHPDITCRCDGIIEDVVDGTDAQMELTEEGRFVKVKCSANFASNAAWGNIYMAYRHLQSVAINPATSLKWAEGDAVSKNGVLGVMGSSGATSTNHLHYSVQRKEGTEFINLMAMRSFDPASALPYFPKHLAVQNPPTDLAQLGATIYQLGYWSTKALFRVVLPATMANARAILVELEGGGYSRTYDFEEVSRLADLQTNFPNESECLDNNEFVPGLALFANSFNRSSSARFHYRRNMFCMPIEYPASPQRGLGNSFPVPNDDDVFFAKSNFPLYVLDVLVKDLPDDFDITALKIKVLDVWGYGISAYGTNDGGPSVFTEPTNTAGACTVNTIELPPGAKAANPRSLAPATGLKIWPNPASDFLQIQVSDTEKWEVSLFDLRGKLMHRQLVSGIQTIGLTDWPSGLYTLQAVSGERIFGGKIVKY